MSWQSTILIVTIILGLMATMVAIYWIDSKKKNKDRKQDPATRSLIITIVVATIILTGVLAGFWEWSRTHTIILLIVFTTVFLYYSYQARKKNPYGYLKRKAIILKYVKDELGYELFINSRENFDPIKAHATWTNNLNNPEDINSANSAYFIQGKSITGGKVNILVVMNPYPPGDVIWHYINPSSKMIEKFMTNIPSPPKRLGDEELSGDAEEETNSQN